MAEEFIWQKLHVKVLTTFAGGLYQVFIKTGGSNFRYVDCYYTELIITLFGII